MTLSPEKSPTTPADSQGAIDTLCRDCTALAKLPNDARRCAACGSPRLLKHAELTQLGVAHLDCDAFYAAVEKRDNPELIDKPVIIGGGRRGVVSTCCYVARIHGVHSAMPMFQATKACPKAVILPPDMEKYGRVGREVRALMQELTPLVEPLSIDEAFMDLRGTERLHGGPPVLSLLKLVQRIEAEIGITVSIGLSHNKFLAKLSSDFDKPRGFSLIGQAETLETLAALPVSAIWGVGKVMQARLERDGIRQISQLQKIEESELARRYEATGLRLARLAKGQDTRAVIARAAAKSISSETTFTEDLSDGAALEKHLWRLSERTAERCKAKAVAGKTLVLKMKADRLSSLTRSRTLSNPTQLADVIFEQGRDMMHQLLADKLGTRFRLIGIGLSGLVDEKLADPLDLGDPDKAKRKAAEQAMDALRDKFGKDSIKKGRGL